MGQDHSISYRLNRSGGSTVSSSPYTALLSKIQKERTVSANSLDEFLRLLKTDDGENDIEISDIIQAITQQLSAHYLTYEEALTKLPPLQKIDTILNGASIKNEFNAFRKQAQDAKRQAQALVADIPQLETQKRSPSRPRPPISLPSAPREVDFKIQKIMEQLTRLKLDMMVEVEKTVQSWLSVLSEIHLLELEHVSLPSKLLNQRDRVDRAILKAIRQDIIYNYQYNEKEPMDDFLKRQQEKYKLSIGVDNPYHARSLSAPLLERAVLPILESIQAQEKLAKTQEANKKDIQDVKQLVSKQQPTLKSKDITELKSYIRQLFSEQPKSSISSKDLEELKSFINKQQQSPSNPSLSKQPSISSKDLEELKSFIAAQMKQAPSSSSLVSKELEDLKSFITAAQIKKTPSDTSPTRPTPSSIQDQYYVCKDGAQAKKLHKGTRGGLYYIDRRRRRRTYCKKINL